MGIILQVLQYILVAYLLYIYSGLCLLIHAFIYTNNEISEGESKKKSCLKSHQNKIPGR